VKTTIIIPSRLASSRLPEKALADIFGKSLIMRVYRQALKSKLADEVIIATDHAKIFDHVSSLGAKVTMTSPNHISGTDRIAEVSSSLDSDIIINLQGDEPLINPIQIDDLIEVMRGENVQIGTQCRLIDDADLLFDYNVVKVVRDFHHRALYFSRQALPAFRDVKYEQWFDKTKYYRHIGLYGFKKDVLTEITKLAPSSYELAESLEQLRWLQNGYSIHCHETMYDSIGVDTPDDLERVRDIVLKETFH
jgi:3-deoxy-manno-octulosonate cytidylyltransferase (CMP-KDO synthetase)